MKKKFLNFSSFKKKKRIIEKITKEQIEATVLKILKEEYPRIIDHGNWGYEIRIPGHPSVFTGEEGMKMFEKALKDNLYGE